MRLIDDLHEGSTQCDFSSIIHVSVLNELPAGFLRTPTGPFLQVQKVAADVICHIYVLCSC